MPRRHAEEGLYVVGSVGNGPRKTGVRGSELIGGAGVGSCAAHNKTSCRHFVAAHPYDWKRMITFADVKATLNQLPSFICLASKLSV